MPSITEGRINQSVLGAEQDGAGEPPGESAPRPGILDRVPDDIRRLLPDEVIDQLRAGAKSEEEILGPGRLLSQLTKRLVERAMEVELTDHLGYEPLQEPSRDTGDTRSRVDAQDASD
jgi:hypothetical protein